MDLLGDIGNSDQLTSVRSENAVLKNKVKELSEKVKELTVENETLKAEVELYRKEAALPSFSSLTLRKSATSDDAMDTTDQAQDDFVVSGNGTFASEMAVSLTNLHSNANPLCCALNPDDTILLTGGADGNVALCAWGGALAPTPGAMEGVVNKAVRVSCGAPVISAAFSQEGRGKTLPIACVGCMDGSVHLIWYSMGFAGVQASLLSPDPSSKHTKYVKTVCWSPTAPVVASASADGTVQIQKVSNLNDDESKVNVDVLQKLHLNSCVETICFTPDGKSLVCYSRETPYLSFFDLEDNFKQTKMNLNSGATAGGFQDHVSFAVMDMAFSPISSGQQYLALATDTSRNMIFDVSTGKPIRNLYGHKNEGFSNPKLGWSSNGQYIFGNTEEDGSIFVWDIASGSVAKKLDEGNGGHGMPVRAMFASKLSDTVVTTSFDKHTKIWLVPM